MEAGRQGRKVQSTGKAEQHGALLLLALPGPAPPEQRLEAGSGSGGEAGGSLEVVRRGGLTLYLAGQSFPVWLF